MQNITKRCTKIVGISVFDQFMRLKKDTDTAHVWLVLGLGRLFYEPELSKNMAS